MSLAHLVITKSVIKVQRAQRHFWGRIRLTGQLRTTIPSFQGNICRVSSKMHTSWYPWLNFKASLLIYNLAFCECYYGIREEAGGINPRMFSEEDMVAAPDHPILAWMAVPALVPVVVTPFVQRRQHEQELVYSGEFPLSHYLYSASHPSYYPYANHRMPHSQSAIYNNVIPGQRYAQPTQHVMYNPHNAGPAGNGRFEERPFDPLNTTGRVGQPQRKP